MANDPKNGETEQRKSEHIDIVLNKNVTGSGLTTGFESYRLLHQALPEIAFDTVSLKTTFLHKTLKTPFLISSMTGGTKRAKSINQNLALAAEEHGWAMGVGSTRAAIEKEELTDTFNVRALAPSIPLLANLGAVQLNYGYGLEECKKAVDLVQADALVLHLNSMQEVFQRNGDTNFSYLINKIEAVAQDLDVPVGVKEVGFGIHGKLAKRLYEAGVSFVDIAGAGGTSWIQVEKERAVDPVMKKAAEAFQDWGLATADCISDVRKHHATGTLVASGGIESGVDAAKAIALRADLVGFGRSLLRDATDSFEAVTEKLSQIEIEFKIAMFGVGASDIRKLQDQPNILRKE